MCPARLCGGMKLALACSILLVAVPLASADQDVSVGPARVVTTNTDQGDACGGDNGAHGRQLDARAELVPGENVGASFFQYCSDQTSESYEQHGHVVFVGADRRVDNNAGPAVYVVQNDNDMNGWHVCGTWVGVVGVTLALGCMPAGTKVPILPTLP